MTRAPRHQAGFALVSAIFLIVVLAALGAFMVTIGGVQHTTTSQAVLAARAYFGAKAGLDWGIHQVIPAGVCPVPASFSPAGAGLNGITVNVNCTSPAANVFYIQSTAQFGTFGTADFAQRRLEATVTNLP